MPKRTSYAQGTPNWVDLQTTDVGGARSFYGQLFGWDFREEPMPDGPVYTMAVKADGVVAGIAPQPEQMRGTPPAWNTYLSVESVDDAAKRAVAAGGQTLMPPFDVLDAGRMTFVLDPTGASIGLWQAKEHIGATVVNEPGTVIWNELRTNNVEAAVSFYGEVAGLTAQNTDMAGTPYTLLKAGGEQVAGVFGQTDEEAPSHWHVFFNVENAATGSPRGRELGGRVLVEAMDMPIGSMATLQDPQGATFSLFAPHGSNS